jgi:hypothetical protein
MGVIKHTILLSSLLISSPGLALAQEPANVHPYLTEKFFTDLGVFFPDRRIKMSAQGSTSEINELVDFNEEFGLNESDETFAVDLGWRFAEKWVLLGQYFDSSGSSRWTLDKDIEWQDVVFQEGSNAVAGFDFSVTRVFLGRELDTSVRHEIGLGVGFHWLKIGAFIDGTIIVGGGGTVSHRESENSEQPLPNIGAWYKYSITPQWVVRGRIDWLDADVGRYDGEMINFSFGINYQIAKHFGLGLNYNDFELDIIVDQTDWRGRIFTAYQGLYLYMSAYW